MADQDGARTAIFDSIEDAATSLKKFNAQAAAPALRDLAYAWRALVGGTQPGSVVIKD